MISPTAPHGNDRVVELLQALVVEMRAVRVAIEAREPALVQSPTADDELIGLAQIGALLHLNDRTVRRLRAGEGFPSPAIDGRSPRWKRTVIEAWRAQRGAS